MKEKVKKNGQKKVIFDLTKHISIFLHIMLGVKRKLLNTIYKKIENHNYLLYFIKKILKQCYFRFFKKKIYKCKFFLHFTKIFTKYKNLLRFIRIFTLFMTLKQLSKNSPKM